MATMAIDKGMPIEQVQKLWGKWVLILLLSFRFYAIIINVENYLYFTLPISNL